ncbi:MAG: family 78 glycoside hydrolase catalytic domain [Ignavibacteriales bacterium]|nr:family 78 glycoside hydrolase catalytic domain [Ignavibacteriales bacterium]
MRHSFYFVLAACLIHCSVLSQLLAPQAANSGSARWISPYVAAGTNEKTPCPIMRSTFTLGAEVATGIVRIVGLGHYELYLNGKRVGNALIKQPWSQYDKTLYWQEFDVSNLLRRGENVWGAMLGNSFWHVGPANDSMRYVKTDAMPDFSSGYPYLLWLEARIMTKDGKQRVIASDDSWKWIEGPLTFSHIYAGEDYDAQLFPAGWNAPGFNDHTWKTVQIAPAPPATLERYSGPSMEAFETFKPVKIVSPAPGEYTYVFPQNCSALVRFTVTGAAGKIIRFKPCEYMDSTGHVKFTYTWGTHKDIWHDYTTRSDGNESHQILFCYVGCQYVGVTGAVPEGYPNPKRLPVVKKLELVHVRAANPLAGTFTCSSELQNGAERMIDWSIRSNMSYVATDCPHREKNGWQEENWHMARAMSYRFNTERWFVKIAHDLRDTQLPDGHVPTNCPNYLVGIPPHGYWNEAPEWGISSVLVPWHIYEWYGNESVLQTNFESMRKFVDYLSSTAKDGIINSNLGDWYDYGHGKGDGPSQWTPNELSATAIWALGAKTVAQAATVLGKTSEAATYEKLFNQIKQDFQRRFYDATTKTLKNNGSCQAAHSAAICVGLVPEQDRAAVLQAIVDDLEKRNWQQTVGEVLQVFFIRALAEGSRNDVLHRVYARENRGSYGYMVKQGFTSLPESWDAQPGTGNSMNHFMLGHLMEWHYAYVAGIQQQPGSVGWEKVLIAPNPGPLESASASFNSPSGMIVVNWRQANGKFEMTVTIPRGIAAEALLPDGSRQVLKAGKTIMHGKSSK